MNIIYYSLLIIWYFSKIGIGSRTILNIGKTSVQGIVEGRNGHREYYAFRGIRYAVPTSRWIDPVLLEIDGNEINATKPGEICAQMKGKKVVGSEDCLYLNIFTKKLPPANIKEFDDNAKSQYLYPVMVYIHGGGFVFGSSMDAGPRRLLTSDDKIVLVSVNYRLGVFGFLSTGDSSLPGNYGMLDLVTSLDWIQKYIIYFGGDPKSVTIFGHSAGGAAVHHLTLSPLTQGKIHRAMIHSGNALSRSNFEVDPIEYAKKIANKVACPNFEDHADMVLCLQRQSTENLIKAQEDISSVWVYPKRCVPVIDKYSRTQPFLPESPEKLISLKNRTNSIPLLVGLTSDEGFYAYSKIHNLFFNEIRNERIFRQDFLPQLISAFQKPSKHELKSINFISDVVYESYFGGFSQILDPTIMLQETITSLVDLIGDILFYTPQHDLLRKYSQGNQLSYAPIYSYVFTHRTHTSPRMDIVQDSIELLKQRNVNHPLFDLAVVHGDDILYIFQNADATMDGPFKTDFELSVTDERVATAFVKGLINFAKNGTPTFDLIDPMNPRRAQIWEPIGKDVFRYFNISSTTASMGHSYRKFRCDFWLQSIPYLQSYGSKMDKLMSDLSENEENLNEKTVLLWTAITFAIIFLLCLLIMIFLYCRKE